RSELAIKYCSHGSIRSQSKTGIQNAAAVSRTKRLGGRRPKTKTLYLPFPTLGYIGMATRGVLSSLPFSPINLDKGPSVAAMDVGAGEFASNCPIAGSQTWPG